MSQLAQRPNISVKLGGVMLGLAAFDYTRAPLWPTSVEIAALWRPYEPASSSSQVERCMCESNFPLEKMASGYRVLRNAFKRVTAGASEAEKQALYAGTTARV